MQAAAAVTLVLQVRELVRFRKETLSILIISQCTSCKFSRAHFAVTCIANHVEKGGNGHWSLEKTSEQRVFPQAGEMFER